MRYLLRDIRSGRFLKNQNDWPESRDAARAFESIEEAIETAATLEIGDLEVFFGTGGIRLPVPMLADRQFAFKEKSS